MDSGNELLKIKNATGELKEKDGVMGKTTKALPPSSLLAFPSQPKQP